MAGDLPDAESRWNEMADYKQSWEEGQSMCQHIRCTNHNQNNFNQDKSRQLPLAVANGCQRSLHGGLEYINDDVGTEEEREQISGIEFLAHPQRDEETVGTDKQYRPEEDDRAIIEERLAIQVKILLQRCFPPKMDQNWEDGLKW